MTSEIKNLNTKTRVAGALYLLAVPLGAFGIMYVPATLVIPGDTMATIQEFVANDMMARLAIVAALITQLVHIAWVVFLHRLLGPVDRFVALIMLILMVVSVPIAMLNEVNLAAALYLVHLDEPPVALVSTFLNIHDFGINIAQIFWGLWLFPYGYLIFKSTFLPKFLGVLLMIGCFGYAVDSFIYILDPDFGIKFAPILFIGELTAPLWFLFKGVDVAAWKHQAAS